MERPNPSTDPSPSPEELQRQYQSLRTMLIRSLLVMLVVCAAVGLFLLRQVFQMNSQVTQGRRLVVEFQANAQPRINGFIASLQAFAKTNSDFNPILAKYGLLPMPPAPVPAPASKAATPRK